MNKLKLRLANIEGTELLTREQLKKVMGGENEGGSGRFCPTDGGCDILGNYLSFDGYHNDSCYLYKSGWKCASLPCIDYTSPHEGATEFIFGTGNFCVHVTS